MRPEVTVHVIPERLSGLAHCARCDVLYSFSVRLPYAPDSHLCPYCRRPGAALSDTLVMQVGFRTGTGAT